MVIASHIIFTTYGFWLPNDPRGSWSDFVRSWELHRFGEATKTNERRSLAQTPHDRNLRIAMKSALRFDPVRFSAEQIELVAKGFARAVSESEYEVHACAIMQDHCHLVVARHANPAERIIGHLKARAAQSLSDGGLHPFSHLSDAEGRFPSVWAHRGWKVFLDHEDGIPPAIDYVESNPGKSGLPRQHWDFVITRG
jgi:REP element-mobilizing transposase RayT